MSTRRRSWVFYLPEGMREQPAWVFIGVMCMLSGLSYLLGLATSSITEVLNPTWLRVWGAFLMTAGILMLVAVIGMNKPLERLALRFLSLSLMVYAGWVATAIPFNRVVMTVTLFFSFVVLAEIRVAVIKALLKPLPSGFLEGGK